MLSDQQIGGVNIRMAQHKFQWRALKNAAQLLGPLNDQADLIIVILPESGQLFLKGVILDPVPNGGVQLLDNGHPLWIGGKGFLGHSVQ